MIHLEAWWNTHVRFPLPWVSTLGPAYWSTRQCGDTHGPEKYIKLQPESHVLLEAIRSLAGRNDHLLELGPGIGRHMAALKRRGYWNVFGLDVQPSHKPNRLVGTFQEHLPLLASRLYTVVYTMGMTVELVPPDFPLVFHLARITKKAVVLMIQEQGVPYPRLWDEEFAQEGFVRTRYEHISQASLMVFVRKA